MSNYDQVVKKIKTDNEPLIAEFSNYLKDEGLSPKTIKNHMQNISFFAEYLIYYEPYLSLHEVESCCEVSSFLGDFFPRKAMWASPASIKSNIATFKKFFKWMIAKNKMRKDEYEYLLELIKEEKENWIESATFEDDYY